MFAASWRGVWESLKQAAGTARAHPLRSALGSLAMATGVATVAAVVMALDGLVEFTRTTTARAFGADSFLLANVAAPGSLGRRELQEKLERNRPIRRGDVRFLERWAGDDVLYAPSAQTSGQATASGRRFENAAITGTSEALAAVRDLGLARGRFLSRDDGIRAAQVAVIGHDVAETLFPGLDALGRAVRMGGRGFEVIGVQSRLGTISGASMDRYVWIPLSTFERVFGGPTTLQVFARDRRPGRATQAEDRTRTTMRARRRLRPGAEDDFDVLAPEASRDFVAVLTTRLSGAAAPLAVMALLAAIVVITNTTLVSVAQRTREIALRRALGARRRRIVLEVVFESALVAVTGGAAGLLAAAGTGTAVRALTGLPASVTAPAVLWSAVSAATAGIVAGLYPAWKAARTDVIAALRVE